MKKKKYNKKYYTGGRVDMSKGGRVKAQVGGIQKAPMSRRRPPMSIDREGEVQPTTQPITQAPVESKRPNVVQPQATPKDVTPVTETKPNQPTFQQAPVESKRPDVVQPAEQPVEPTFTQAPTTGKGSGQMFIGRTDEETRATQVQPSQAQQETIMTEEEFNKEYGEYEGVIRGRGAVNKRDNFYKQRKEAYDDYVKFINDSKNNIGDSKVVDGFTYIYTPNGWVDTGQKADETNNQEKEQVKQDLVTARGRAEQILQGDMTGIPMAEAPKEVEVGELGVAKTMAEREALQARLAEVEAAPEAKIIEDIETVKTPEELQAETYKAEQVARTPEVEVATGEVVEDALAKAAKVDRVAPIEGAEVEIPEGALAERVVGTISEGAKATAALNVGTSLSRITRAKKQLSRAGLSDADIEEIGNDPEALEDRLADFSEEQRGIIEGLPQEALVSTQMNNLLEGIESGEIPTWARPAVAQVEQMLARRGMSASTVGRDSLFNAIIQSAMPIAQSNAQAIQQSVSQQKTIEAQTAEANAQRMQQTALTNAQNVFNMDMAQFTADQQTALSNSKFMQTVGLTEASNRQQATIQNAVLMSQANLAEADFYQKAQINNAQTFLQMDLANLSNQQQANVLKAQQEQQRLLSNQAATNAAAQFNASSENQTQQFMTSIAAQIEQFNAAQMNTAAQFNVQQQNAREALEFQVEADLEKANAAMVNQINQFNEQTAFERDKFNTANAQAIEQSNLAWRRQANTINTAAANQVAMQNAQNAFNMTSQAQSFLWQELRDQANYVWQSAENEENRKAQLYAQALANEGGSAENWKSNISSVGTLINTIFGGK